MEVSIKIYPKSWTDMLLDRAGMKYQPGNGDEGAMFHESWCGNCARDKAMSEGKPLEECDDNEKCDILARSFHNINDPDYPTEWQYGADGQPRCHAFVEVGKPIPFVDELTGDLFGSIAAIQAKEV